MGGVEYQVTKVDPTDPHTKGAVYQVHKVSEEIAATLGGKVYRARIINDPTAPTVAGKVYQIVLIGDPSDPAVKGKVYNAILIGGSEAVVVGPAVSPLALDDAIADTLEYVKAYGGTELRTVLPDGYTQLEYVTFDATQVIDTGFIPDNNSRIESKCYRTGADCWFYGASPANPCVTLYHSSTGTCRWGNQSRSNVGFVADTEYTIIEDKNGININGVDNPWTSGTAGDFTCDRSLTIGNCNGGTGTRYFAGNFYYMRIYDNGVLARDFVPCKNASNVVGLYDRVNDAFYTETGLVAGPNAVPTPNCPMDIVTNNGVLKARHQSGLPLGYTLLEYIDTDGNSWIDTGITPTATTLQLDYKMQMLQQDYVSLFGAVAATTPRYGFRVYYQPAGGATNILNWQSGSFGGQQSIVWNDVLQGVVIATQGVSVVSTINGVTQTYNSSSIDLTQSDTMLLGTTHLGTTSGRAPTRIWSFKITKDGILVRNFVPAKNSSNTIGMYDFVSGQFFTNQGTGDFVAGNTVSDPVEIYTDGTVETIEDTIGNTANVLEITQASLNGLELEAEYEKEAE